MSEQTEWFHLRFGRQALAVLRDLQERHLITFEVLGNGRLVKYKITDWHKHNRVLEYNAPCQKDTGFFFLPVCIANQIIGTRRPSEMDIILDLWLNTVYNDDQVCGSEIAPVVYIRNGSGSPLVSYTELSQRYNLSKATISRYLKKFEDLDLIALNSFPGTHGTVISLKNYLSTMFQISDVMLDKEEIAMALHITINLQNSVTNDETTVSELDKYSIMQKVKKVLVSQGFLCFECSRFRYKLLELSDCRDMILIKESNVPKERLRYNLKLYCGEQIELAQFELLLTPSN